MTIAPLHFALTGAEVVVGDLIRVEDVALALDGCWRMYFGMSVSGALPGGDGHRGGRRAGAAATWRCSSTCPR